MATRGESLFVDCSPAIQSSIDTEYVCKNWSSVLYVKLTNVAGFCVRCKDVIGSCFGKVGKILTVVDDVSI